MVLQQTIDAVRQISEGVPLNEITASTLEGADRSMEVVIEKSGEHAPEVIDALTELGISEALTEKLKRERNHIRDSLEKRYDYDKIEGTLMFVNNRLVIQNQYGLIDLASEWNDVLNKETIVTIRRVKRDILI